MDKTLVCGTGTSGSTPGESTQWYFALRERRKTRWRSHRVWEKTLSLRDKLERRRRGEVGGFVSNRMVSSNFLDEGGNLGEIVGFVQKSGLLQV